MNLSIKNISKKYDNKFVLEDVSLELKRGEVFCIFGILSVGKSVLMRILAGLEKADSGSIFFDKLDLTNCSQVERGFQFPEISNDIYWKSLFNTRKRSELADGEGQLLAFENAFKATDKVLLLDNSFCQMDRRTRHNNYELIRQQVKEKNLLVLFASNDYEEVFQVADKVAVLSNGKILQTGTPREIYEKPDSKLVAEVFGDYNLIPARRLTSSKSEQPEFHTIIGGHSISTAKIAKEDLGAINQTITLAIRPENISISFGASFPEDNLIKAKVTEIKFQGSTTLIKLNANGLELRALVLRLVGLNVGDECMVGLPPDRILVLKD